VAAIALPAALLLTNCAAHERPSPSSAEPIVATAASTLLPSAPAPSPSAPIASGIGLESLHLGWTWPADDGQVAGSWITAGVDGQLYPVDSTGALHALLPSGEESWRFRDSYEWITPSLISRDTQVVYVFSDSGEIYALSADGALRWKHKMPFLPRWMPLVAPDGAVYVTSQKDAVRVSPDGRSETSFVWPEPASTNEAVFDGEGRLYAPGSKEIWVYSAQGEKVAACPWDDYVSNIAGMKGGGFVYSTGFDQVHAISPNCARMWSYPAAESTGGYQLVAVSEAGTVFALRKDGEEMLVLDGDGTLLWQGKPEGVSRKVVYLGPSFDGGVMVMDETGKLYAYDEAGRRVWHHAPYFAGRPGPPQRAGDGLAYVHGGKLHYFTADPARVQPEPTPMSPPPDGQAAQAEIVAFVVDFILKEEIRGTAEYVRAAAQDIVPGPPEACIIVWGEKGSPKKVWWYTDQGDTLAERQDMQAAITEYREKYIETAKTDIFAYGSYDFAFESVAEDRSAATVNVGAHCGPLCGHGVRYRLMRSPSGEWWIAGSDHLWQS